MNKGNATAAHGPAGAASLVLVDDHRMIRRGFAAWLSSTGRFYIAGEAASLDEARVLFQNLAECPALVLLDLALGKENGLELIPFLTRRYGGPGSGPAILIYSVFENPFRIQEALRMGACGYVSKSAEDAVIAEALDRTLAGERYLDRRLEKNFSRAAALLDCLTRQEREVLSLIQKNFDNRRIARSLGLTGRTVENYLTRLYSKTGAKTRADLIAL